MWDLFISHASEDKEGFVKPLADELKHWGVKVWYDEFELKLGDSLSQSIDEGLIDSRFGIVILSKAFFSKQWTQYELQSLITKVMEEKSVILPIWHEISKDEISKHSLFLADKVAASSSESMETITAKILNVVRPDLLNSRLLIRAMKQIRQNAKDVDIHKLDPRSLTDGPIRHDALPFYLVIATRLLSEVFSEVFTGDYLKMLDGFSRDADYDSEFIVWSSMANAYVAFIRECKCGFEDIDKKREAFNILLAYSWEGFDENRELKCLSQQEYMWLVKEMQNNLIHINDMLEKYV